MRRHGQPIAGFALQLLLAVAVIHNGIAGAAAAEPGAMAGDSMAMAHHGHDGMTGDDGSGESGTPSDCCDDPGCVCGCAAPQACLADIAHAGSTAVQCAAIAPYLDGLPPIAEITAPFRPPA